MCGVRRTRYTLSERTRRLFSWARLLILNRVAFGASLYVYVNASFVGSPTQVSVRRSKKTVVDKFSRTVLGRRALALVYQCVPCRILICVVSNSRTKCLVWLEVNICIEQLYIHKRYSVLWSCIILQQEIDMQDKWNHTPEIKLSNLPLFVALVHYVINEISLLN
jgi:hypothetical protein